MTGEIAIVLLGESARPTALKIAAALPGARLHGLAGRVGRADVAFADTGAHLRALFKDGVAIVGLAAAGVLVRTLAPMLEDKRREPPVVAVAEDGSAVVPLLGGHHGANALARRIGEALGVAPAITTAGEVRFAVALDEPPPGWRLANPEHVKPFTSALLAGAGVRLDGVAPWLAESGLPFAAAGPLEICVSERRLEGTPERLVYHPAVIALGVGCERGASAQELAALVEACLAQARAAPAAVAGLFSLDLKMDEPAILALAERLGLPLRFFSAAELEAETPRLLNPSEAVFREVGCHGVAEAAALAAAGKEGRLVRGKERSRRATCAIALAPRPIPIEKTGRARGRLFIVGIGPGGEAWLTPEASGMIEEASDLVGYGLYLDLLGARTKAKRRHDFALGEEEARVKTALALAAEGRTAALVSSGDPGIYAMASLAFELLERAPQPWRGIEVRVAPGISAMQAAAARAGAPLGHDFAAISLSDLLTPWEAIERRLEAAAAGDFVVALYNPVSRRRRHQLETARSILLKHRAPDTPVILARNLGRDGETLEVVRLAELEASRVDMLTVVLIGSTSTRAFKRGDGALAVYTPRGYGNARPAKTERAR